MDDGCLGGLSVTSFVAGWFVGRAVTGSQIIGILFTRPELTMVVLTETDLAVGFIDKLFDATIAPGCLVGLPVTDIAIGFEGLSVTVSGVVVVGLSMTCSAVGFSDRLFDVTRSAAGCLVGVG